MSDTRLGATPHEDGSCSFEVWAPYAERVQLVLRRDGDVTGNEARHVLLEPGERGYHRARVEDVPAGDRYAFLLDDDPLELPDPASASQPDGVHAASQVVDHGAHRWTASGWSGMELRDYVIYELHVGTFTPEGTFDAIVPRLTQLAADGITAIELLPIGQFPGARNWGYDGVDLFAAQSSYGGPEGLRRLVDAAHAAGIAVVLDVVYNHLGPEGNYLGRFGAYFSEHHHTPWGDAVNVDGPASDEVRRFFIENALLWLRDYRIDALRLDAIHGIVDTSANPFLGELSDAVAELASDTGRRIHLIAESDLNDARVITPRDLRLPAGGGIGCDTQWTDDFHHALRVALTGERSGYYADFDGVADLARSYANAFVYTGQHSEHRGRRHGNSPAGLPGSSFVVYAQNHDQIGNRLLGDRLSTAVDGDRLRLAAAAVLLSPFVPMLFMGEEYGERAPFPYFVSHTDADLVEAVRRGRREEFASFGFEGKAPDPQGEETFAAAVLDWDLRERGEHAAHLAFVRELLRLRRERPSIRDVEPAELDARADADAGLVTVDRHRSGERSIVVLAFGQADVDLGSVQGMVEDGVDLTAFERVLDSSDQRFGGSGIDPALVRAGSAAVFCSEAGE